MLQSFYTASAGISSQQKSVDTIANNIANIGTCGYKTKRANFKDLLYSEMMNPENLNAAENLEYGNGATVASTVRINTQGVMQGTGQDLDFFIDGDGYFTLADTDGEYKYTRAGNLAVSYEDPDAYLVNSDGDYVLDATLNRIVVPDGTDGISVDADGILYDQNNVQFAEISLVTFPNLDGLESVGDSCFKETEVSGEPIESDATLVQGYLEASNVDLGLELTRLIRATSAFSIASKAAIISDDMISAANNLR